MNLVEIWHYHRPELATLYLNMLNAGLVTSTTIFAPRRVGKTSFLLKDLAPAAIQMGYRVAYVDLWQTKLAPAVAIIAGLEHALAEYHQLSKRLSLKKLKASAAMMGTKFEGEIELKDLDKREQTELALQIDRLIEKLCRKKPLLLLIDEAQALAKTKAHEAIATALRTAMMKHQKRLRVVFTGSSRTQLSEVFSNATAPLYSTGAAVTEFPKLNRDFIEYIAKRFSESTGRTLDIETAWQAFFEFNQQPEPFLIGIVDMVLHPTITLNEAMEAVKKRLLHADNYSRSWAALNETQKALLRMLACDSDLKPFSQEVLSKLRQIIGIESLQTTHIQRAMSKLSPIVTKFSDDHYEFEDPAFAEWIQGLAS